MLQYEKPLTSSANQQKKLDFVSKHIVKNFSWKTELFIDESKFNIFGCDGLKKIC